MSDQRTSPDAVGAALVQAGFTAPTAATPFAGWTVLGTPIEDGDQAATWHRARAALTGTGWDAVVHLSWSGETFDTAAWGRREEFGHDHRADAGPLPATWAPDDVLRAAAGWTDEHLDVTLDELDAAQDADTRSWATADELVELQLGWTASVSGDAPDPGDVPVHLRHTASALERWLLDWELANAEPSRDWLQDWFEPTGMSPVLWAVPRTDPWAFLAVEQWWAADQPFTLALARRWHARWGAQLVSHLGTMLHALAQRRPSTVDDAWQLAREQDLVCDALLAPPGIARRHHALGLMQGDRWFLHSRP